MPSNVKERKRIELSYLNAARKAGVPIPPGETPAEEPDFRFHSESGALGIELSEVMKPASSNHGILPIFEEAMQREIIANAQRAYYAAPNAQPVHVNVNFADRCGRQYDKREMARRLAEFVQTNSRLANPAKIFMHDNEPPPEGFFSVLLQAEDNPQRDWWFGSSGGINLSEIRPEVEARIAAKDALVPTYRANLPNGAQLWLLLHSGVTIPRSMPIPHGAENWRISFRFDRVFWFAELDGFVEIHRTESIAVPSELQATG